MSSFVPHPRPKPKKRKLQKVPFVELFDGRLQGVVSSGSDIHRVYVSLIQAGTGNYYCSTNNNRPCGGLGGGGCKHIAEMVSNAIDQYGAERVARYLGLPEEQTSAWGIIGQLGGTKEKVESGEVFARFLDYLRYVELPASAEPRPDMAWFVTG
ncbi:MAG: hypothetical protein H6737_14000 [Alphaproteobacteria bacterium]|nr:hypothetical protein [Alphaproteobacteria bacterium]